MMQRIPARLGAALVVLLALGVAAVGYRIEIAGALLRYGLSRAGFPQSRFTIERVGPRDIAITDVEAGDMLRLGRVEIGFDLRHLPRSPLDRVRVVGARIALRTGSESNEVSTQEKQSSSGGFPLAVLPALELEDVVVAIPTEMGPISLRLDSHVTPEDRSLRMRLDGAVESSAGRAALRAEARRDPEGAVSIGAEVSSLDVRIPWLRITGGSATVTLDAVTTGLDLRSATGRIELSLQGVEAGGSRVGTVVASIPVAFERQSGEWVARLSKADLRLPDRDLQVSGISGDASSQSADLEVERLAETASTRRFEPLSFHLHIPEVRPDLQFVIDVKAAAGRAALSAHGQYASSRRAAEVDVSLPRLEFRPERLRPLDLSPLLVAAGQTSGSLQAKAHLRWQPSRGFSGTATIELDGLSLDPSVARVDGLSGNIELLRLSPLGTAGVQTLQIREVNPGVAFSDALLRWALEPTEKADGSRLRIAHFESRFADGRVTVDDALLDPFAEVNRLEFDFREIDVARLFEIAGIEGVSGTGHLSGSIPVAVREAAVSITGGKLTAEGGELHIQSQAIANLLAGGGESVQLLLDALRNFHYEKLTLTVEKGFDGEARVDLHLEGRNPDVVSGRPFRINLNLSGNLDRLTRSLLEVARLSDRAVRATVGAMR